MRLPVVLLVTLAIQTTLSAQSPNWQGVDAEALKTLQSYIRINTSVPPGDVTKAADLLAGILEREGIPVKRFESGPGRSIIMARLKGSGPAKPLMLLHHMDVVPADAARWSRDPFGGEIADGKIWGRGALDMKGPGVAQLYAFIMLKRQNVTLDRDIILMAVPDEEVGGGLGATWMRNNHYDEFEPEYILDEGGFGSRDLFSPGKLVFGISVAEKKLLWLKLTAEGVAGHGSQPHDKNPNDRLVRALRAPARRASADDAFQRARYTAIAGRDAGREQVQQRDPALDDRDHHAASRRGRAAEGERHSVDRRGDARLPCPARDDEGAVAERNRPPARRFRHQDRGDLRVAGPCRDDHRFGVLPRPRGAVKKQYPDAIVTPTIMPYTTDSNGFRPRGVKSYGFTPAILPAEVVASMHGDAEYLPVDVIGPAMRIIYEALVTTAGRR